MKSEEYYRLSQLTAVQRFQLMFGQKITPQYPMPITPEQRADIHRDALNYWHTEPNGTLHGLADVVIEKYEMLHSPSQMERTNAGLGLEVEALKARLAAENVEEQTKPDPDMLKSLKETLGSLEIHCLGRSKVATDSIIGRARAIIARAEGRAP